MKPIQPVAEALSYTSLNERSSVSPLHSPWAGPIVMFLATLISYIDRQTLSVLAPTILPDVHLNATDFGYTLSAFSIAYMFANPIWGSILDRIGLPLGMA